MPGCEETPHTPLVDDALLKRKRHAPTLAPERQPDRQG
jgi:hypothetical protein